MKNTKRTLIFSSLVLALALVVVVISVTAAWFGNTMSVSNTINISSEKEVVGNATIDVSSASPERVDDRSLTPAVIKKGLLLGDYTGAYNGINVLNAELADSAGTDSTKPLVSVANTVTVYFPFIYNGGPDQAVGGDRKKSIEISLSSATLENPRVTHEDGTVTINNDLPNFLEQFAANILIVTKTTTTTQDEDGNDVSTDTYTPVASTPVADLPNSPNTALFWERRGDALWMVLTPGITYYCAATLNFAKVDEECSPQLIDTTVWFNFEIAAVPRSQI